MSGPPVLLLHGFSPFPADSAFVGRIAKNFSVTAPVIPDFSGSPRLDSVETVYDLVHFVRTLLERWPPGEVSLVGCSFGGWIAAEIAAAAPRYPRRLVLIDPVGIKVSGRETPDILDIFNTHPAIVRQCAWHDMAKAPSMTTMTDEALIRLAQDRAALCRYGWHPYLHNPRLRYWLHRISTPTLLLWGESDRIVTPAYGAAFASLIPGARLRLITAAGHHPEIEQPEVCADVVAEFLSSPM